MKLPTFKITDIADNTYEVEAFDYGQAITIWKKQGHDGLFARCTLDKKTKDYKRYWALRELISTGKATRCQVGELRELCKNIRKHDIFKQNRTPAFRQHPTVNEEE